MAPKYNISVIKQIGIAFKTRISALGAKTDGYLLEISPSWYKQVKTRQAIDPNFNPDSIEKTYELLAISVMGPKHQCDTVLRTQLRDDLYLQNATSNGEQNKQNRHKKQHYFCVEARKENYKLETESEHVVTHSASLVLVTTEKEMPRLPLTMTGKAVKTGTGENRFTLTLSSGSSDILQKSISHLESLGTISEMTKSISGSLYRRIVAINPKIKASNLNGDSKEGYLIGETLDQARGQFWNVLDKLPAPIQPEWEDELWKRFTAYGSNRITGVDILKWRKELEITDEELDSMTESQPWIDELVGHRMSGYKLNLNKESIQLLVSALVYSDILPCVIPDTVAETEEIEAMAA